MKNNFIKFISIFLIGIGLIFSNNLDVNAKDNNFVQSSLKESKEEKISKLEKEKDELETKLAKLKGEQSAEFHANGFSEKYYLLGKDIDDVEEKIDSIEIDIDNLEHVVTPDKLFNVVPIIFIVIFVLAFIGIFATQILSFFGIAAGAKHVSNMASGIHTKDMLNDLSDVAVKMAKELNPTYKEFKCPNCNASLDPENTEIKKCTYCGAKLYKTVDNSSVHKHHTNRNSTHDSEQHKTK